MLNLMLKDTIKAAKNFVWPVIFKGIDIYE